MRKTITALLLALLLILPLCGCSGFDASAYVKGELDALYPGIYAPEFLKQIRAEDSASLEEAYEEGLQADAAFFLQYFYIEESAASEEFLARITSLYRQLYSLSRYEVGEAVKTAEGYTVPVTVYPVDLFASPEFHAAYEAFAEDFRAEAESGAFPDDGSYEAAWAEGILSLAEENLGSAGYLQPQTFSAQIVRNGEGLYVIAEESLSEIDAAMIAY